MKKFVFFVMLSLFAFLIVGCTPDDGGEQTGGETDLELVEQWIIEQVPTNIFGNINLPTTDADGKVDIIWISSNNSVLDSDGFVSFTNVVEEIILTYDISLDGEELSGDITVLVSPKSFDEVAADFGAQFLLFIGRNYTVKTTLYNKFEIEWYSSNTDIFNNDGVYTKPDNDTPIEIKYTITLGEETSEEYVKKVTVLGVSEKEKFNEISAWLTDKAVTDLYLTSELSLPILYEKYNIPIEWKSSNEDVVSKDGKVTQYVFERYITLSAVATIGSYSSITDFECIVKALDTSKMSQTEIIENFLSAIAVSSYSKVNFTTYGNINQSFGALNFYLNENSQITSMIMPTNNSNRTNLPMTPQLVVIHDTGNNGSGATAKANANYVFSGYGGSSTGWHYTTGNDGIYYTIPDNEIAYHANGGSNTPLTWINTGISVTALKPIITIKNSIIHINGISTNIQLPNTARNFASDGVMCEIKDGKYYVAKSWDCSSHGFNANQGGNASGIGIESAVNPGSDYLTTCRITSKLVAELLIKYGLTINRVVQHNTMSGKDCPMAIRSIGFWYTFKDMVSLEKFAKENLSQYTFTWTSNSNILSETGKIALDLGNATSVKYSVAVKSGSTVVVTKSYTTNLNV